MSMSAVVYTSGGSFQIQTCLLHVIYELCNDCFYHMARNEDHTAAISEYNVPRQAYCSADHNRRIEPVHHKITDRRRINAAVINLDSLDSLNLFQIADTAPDNCSSGLCLITDCSGKVSSDKGTLIYLSYISATTTSPST